MLTHANLTASCAIYDAWFNPQTSIKPGDARVVCALPLFHIFALSTVMLRHLSNGNEVLLRQNSTSRPRSTISKSSAPRTSMACRPCGWRCAMPASRKRDLSSLVSCSTGGAALPVEVEHRFETLTGKRLRSGIGMTETLRRGPTQPIVLPGKPGSCGVPLPGVYIEIVALDDPRSRPAIGRDRRDPHQGTECRARLLEPAGGVRRDLHRWHACSPATSATWTRMDTSSSSTARRT